MKILKMSPLQIKCENKGKKLRDRISFEVALQYFAIAIEKKLNNFGR